MKANTETSLCTCLGGSTHATVDPTVRICDLCGGIVPTNSETGELMDKPQTSGRKIFATAQFTY